MIPKHIQCAMLSGLLAMICLGCGQQYPQVTGQITSDGKPQVGVNVLFVPISTKNNPFPGPYAEGVTDSDGRYSLVTRYGSAGATPGPNLVELRGVGSLEAEFLGSEVTQLLSKASDESDAATNQRPTTSGNSQLDADIKIEFNVPEDGTDAANFELTELTEQ